MAASLGAWEDPFAQWQVSAYVQAFGLMRPPGALAPAGVLDNFGRSSGGYNNDGAFVRKLEAKVSGPSGFEGWDAVAGVQTDLNKAAPADLYLERRWQAWGLKLGHCRLPLGWENQQSSAKLPGIQRSLALGMGNYGHTQDWGLGLAPERAYGFRLDALASPDRVLDWQLEAGGYYGKGGGYQGAWMGAARAGFALGRGNIWIKAFFNGMGGYARPNEIPASYAALGLERIQDPALWEQGALIPGRSLLSWGPDLALDLGPLHGRAELLLQSLGGHTRGGGHASVWVEHRKFILLFKAEQAWAGYGDGIHRPHSVYWGQSLGLSLPLWEGATLKAERQVIWNEDLGKRPVPGGEISLVQLQQEL
jgi:hypothetical protein